MAGLLDDFKGFVQSAEGQGLLAAGLGAAANAGRGGAWNTIGRAGLLGLSGYAGAIDRQAEAELRQQRASLYKSQTDAHETALEQQRQKQAYLRGLGQPMTGGEAMANGKGPTIENATNIGQPRQFNPIEALARGFSIDEVQKLAGAGDWGRAKVARTIKGIGPDGREYEYQVDDFGRRVGEGLPQFRAPLMQDLGGNVVALDPYSLKPQAQFGKSMTPDGRDASARGWANLNLEKERFAFDQRTPKGQYDADRGALVDLRTGVATPVIGADGNPIGGKDKIPEAQQKQVVGVKNLSNAIAEYRNELKNFGLGAGLMPNKRALMGTKYNNMMLQAKEAYNLGVLNGPDFEILTSVITDPRSMKGMITSNAALDQQAAELDRIMQGVGQVASQPKPRMGAEPKTASAGAPAPGAVEDGYRFKGGNPADPSAWEKM